MKTAPPELIEHLRTARQFRMADLFTFALVNGEVLRYTAADMDIVYGGHVFSPVGPLIERGPVRCVIGIEVSTLDITIRPSLGDVVAGQAFVQACAAGALDSAEITLERVFLADDLSVIGGFVHFAGLAGDVDLLHQSVALRVDSHLSLLNAQFPRNLYQPGCLHTLYSAGCGLSRSAYGAVSSVNSGSDRSLVKCGLSQASGYFTLGTLEFVSGDLSGVRRAVKAYSVGNVRLLSPLPMDPAVGDGFKVYPGCLKTRQVCADKFGNLSNFRGFPYVPVPETTR